MIAPQSGMDSQAFPCDTYYGVELVLHLRRAQLALSGDTWRLSAAGRA